MSMSIIANRQIIGNDLYNPGLGDLTVVSFLNKNFSIENNPGLNTLGPTLCCILAWIYFRSNPGRIEPIIIATIIVTITASIGYNAVM